MKNLAVVLLAGAALCGTAQAQRFSPISGAKLVEICSARDKASVEACTAYIDGVSDSVAFYQTIRPRDGSKGPALPTDAYICVPTGTTGVQQREAVVAWAKKNPGDMNRQATGVVLRALRDTYRCAG